MALPLRERFASPEMRSGVYYLTMFMSVGAAVTVLPIWLSARGLSEAQIGIVNAMPILLMLVLNMVVGRLADKAADWRSVIVCASLVAAITPLGLFFVSGFWGILFVWTLATLPMALAGPVVDAAVVRLTRRRGSDFGVVRAWGTVGFMVFNAATGVVVAWWGIEAFVPLFVALTIVRGVAALQLPRFRAPEAVIDADAVDTPPNPLVAQHLREIVKPWFLLPLIGCAIIFGAHAMINAFAALIWLEAGISAAVIGPLMAAAALGEAVMMFGFKRFAGRFKARHLLLVAGIATILRLLGMALEPQVALLVVLQAMHALSFAIGYLGSIHFIANWTSERMAAEAQSFFVMLTQAMAIVTLVGFGVLVETIGASAFLVAAGFAGLGTSFIFLSILLKSPQS